MADADGTGPEPMLQVITWDGVNEQADGPQQIVFGFGPAPGDPGFVGYPGFGGDPVAGWDGPRIVPHFSAQTQTPEQPQTAEMPQTTQMPQTPEMPQSPGEQLQPAQPIPWVPPRHRICQPLLTTAVGSAPKLAAGEARALADAEGLMLMTADNMSGFKGVHSNRNKFKAQFHWGSKRRHLGTFSTAEGAALAIARTAVALGADLTAQQARALAEAEGLTLVPADSLTGFRHVSRRQNAFRADTATLRAPHQARPLAPASTYLKPLRMAWC